MFKLAATRLICTGVIFHVLFSIGASYSQVPQNPYQPPELKSADAVLEILKQEDCLSSTKKRLKCCRRKLNTHPKKWYVGGNYLQNLFAELKALKCPQIRPFCKGMLYGNFSEYSKLVYEYHCDQPQFQKRCAPIIAHIRNMDESSSWNATTEGFDSSVFSLQQIKEPCMQLAAYQSPSGGYGFYHEVIAFDIPFCSNVWCGFDAKTIEERGISHWDCMPSRCQAGVIVIAVICIILSVAIVCANVTVILVFATTPELRNSQALYKISLAIADLIVGLIVLPSIVHSLIASYQGQLQLGDVIPNVAKNIHGIQPRKSILPSAFRFTPEYIGLIGFCISLSLLVSIYTLTIASLDRLSAIFKPLKYCRHRAKRVAIWSSLTLWVIGIFFSALPIFINDMPYGVVASVLILSIRTPGLILYAVVVLLPLIVMWVTTLWAYVIIKRQARWRNSLGDRRGSKDSDNASCSMEEKLARTLAAMVGIFTLCLLPAVVTLIVPFGISNIDPRYPRRFDQNASNAFTSVELIAILLLMTNSLWNCFIYNSRSKEFKRKIRFFCGAICTRKGRKEVYANGRSFFKLPGTSSKSASSSDFPATPRKSIETTSVSNTKDNTTTTPIVYRYGRENSIDPAK